MSRRRKSDIYARTHIHTEFCLTYSFLQFLRSGRVRPPPSKKTLEAIGAGSRRPNDFLVGKDLKIAAVASRIVDRERGGNAVSSKYFLRTQTPLPQMMSRQGKL